MEFVSHPLIKPKTVERRSYQLALAASALLKNTLVVLPTGLGKTVVALLVIASRLHKLEGKILFLAPTKPLVEQHAFFLKRTLNINEDEIISFTGEIPPEKRQRMYEKAKVVVSTPQVIENDIISGKLSLKDFVLAIFDEAHRAVGNYSYVFIAKRFVEESKNPLILAITASPGSDPERIREVVKNLFIENIEIRTEYDPDVRKYIAEKKIEWVKVDMPEELEKAKEAFEKVIEIRLKRLERLGFDVEFSSKKELLTLQELVQAQAVESGDQVYYEASSILAEVLKVYHAVELIETQGVEAAKKYLKRLLKEGRSRGSKAAKNLLEDPVFREGVVRIAKIKDEHPKINKLMEILEEQFSKNPDSRIIVFTNFRDTADKLLKIVSQKFPASKFIGQAKRDEDVGMSQKEQIRVLEMFRRGDVKVLIATSVGEEGLDIPETDLVVFYEAVPSEIRAIQRKGRTGRGREGRIVVLITKGTRDEAYYYASLRKEKMMYDMVYRIKYEIERELEKERVEKAETKTLLDFIASPTIYVDSREMKSGVVKKLIELGAKVKVEKLDVGDYVLSDRVAVERKTVDDFLESLINKERDLFGNLINLKKAYPKALLIIEGNGLYTRRNVNPNAVRGALSAIAVDIGIPILFSSNETDTAELLLTIARREQEYRERPVALHSGKSKRTLKDEMEYIVSAISNVGPVIAKNLLKEFQTIEKIATASVEELMKVKNVGRKTAESIRRLMTTKYDEADKIFLEEDTERE